MSTDIDVEIRGKVEAYRAELAKMPGITKDAADKSAASLQKGLYQKAAMQAAGLVKANETAAAASGKAWVESSKKIGELAGGRIATLSNALFELVPKAGAASSALGAVAAAGVGAAASVALVAGAVGGLVALADAADAAEKRLVAAGRAAQIPQDARTAIDAYRKSTSELNTAVDLLTVSLGQEAAGALASVASGLTGLVTATTKAWEFARWGREVANSIPILGQFDDAARTAGISMVTMGFGIPIAKFVEWTGVLNQTTEALHRVSDATTDQWIREAEAEEAIKRGAATRAAAVLAKAQADRTAAAQKAADQRRQIEEQAAAEELRLYQFTGDAIIRESEAVWAAQAETAARYRARDAELSRLASQQLVADTQAAAEATVAIMQQRGAEIATIQQAQAQTQVEVANAAVSLFDTVLSAQINALQKGGKAERKQAMQLAVFQRANAVFGIALNTAVAITRALAELGPVAGGIAASGITATGLAQAAAVAAAPMPSFLRGTDRPIDGARGEPQNVTVHGGEVVLSSRSVDLLTRLLGGGRGSDGAPSGGGPVLLDGRRVGDQLARQVRGGGRLARAVRGDRPTGYVDPYGRR